MKASDAIYCTYPIYSRKNIFLVVKKDMTIAGSGDGNVLVYDNDSGKCLYGFGAMT